MKDPDEIEFQRLVEQAVDDELSSQDAERLQELSSGNRDRLEQLVDHALIASLLTEEGGNESVADLVDLTSGEAAPAVEKRRPGAAPRKGMIPWGIAAALAVALVVSNQMGYFNTESESRPDDGLVGLMVDRAGAKFAYGYAPEQGRFQKGEYRLESGKIHFQLVNGADLVMRAPAAFRLHDPFHLELLSGQLRAVIPPPAEGFTVAAPQVNYEDLGTEFGVSVDDQSGASRIHVFDGQVDAKDAKSKQLLSSVTSGQTMQFADDGWEQAEPPQEGEYPVPGEIGFARWQEWRRDFVKDPSLVAFYSFIRDPEAPGVLGNDIVNREAAANNGSIEGARWVSGRWRGKEALLFDRDEDAVDLPIPGEYDELTLSFWVKADRLDYEYNALLNSDGWESGDLHFQIKRTGLAWANVNGMKSSRPKVVGTPIQQDRWQHIVGVISAEAIRTYVNGELVWEQPSQLAHRVIPNVCSLGAWREIPEQYQPTQRSFKGRMDEVAIWNRALTKTEIEAHYQAGRPSLLDE